MTLPCTIQDLEHKKFVECPVDSRQPAVRTKICQDSNETIKVEFDEVGEIINIYDEALSVAASAIVTVLTYTVPVAKELRIRRLDFTGTNRGEYTVQINSIKFSRKRTYYIDYNGSFTFESYILNAGDTIELIVENKSTTLICDYESNLQGKLSDA